MSKYKLVPVKPTREMLEAGVLANYGVTIYDTVEIIFCAMLAAAPEVEAEVEQEPYAYEYGVSNGDGTFSVVIDKGKFTQLKENEYGYCHPGIFASKEWPVTPLYLHPQPASEVGECRKIVVWAVYDATSDRKYIKMDSSTGCLAFFDTERQAAIFAADCAGADYKELVLYLCPQPADAALVEAFDAGRRAAQAEAAELAGALDEMIEQVVQRVSVCGNFSSAVVLRAIDALAAYRKLGGAV